MTARSPFIIRASVFTRHGGLSAPDLLSAPSFYYSASLFLERKGAAVRYVTQFREYALARKQADASERIKLLAASDLMRHLPAEQIEQILPCIHACQLKAGEILFKAGGPGDALYIVSRGKVEVLANGLPGRNPLADFAGLWLWHPLCRARVTVHDGDRRTHLARWLAGPYHLGSDGTRDHGLWSGPNLDRLSGAPFPSGAGEYSITAPAKLEWKYVSVMSKFWVSPVYDSQTDPTTPKPS
jgi:hypothetical protein